MTSCAASFPPAKYGRFRIATRTTPNQRWEFYDRHRQGETYPAIADSTGALLYPASVAETPSLGTGSHPCPPEEAIFPARTPCRASPASGGVCISGRVFAVRAGKSLPRSGLHNRRRCINAGRSISRSGLSCKIVHRSICTRYVTRWGKHAWRASSSPPSKSPSARSAFL